MIALVQKKANAVSGLLLETRRVIGVFNYPKETERLRLALSLMTASCDHGRALARLVEQDPYELGISAFALFRPQLESFLRGSYFASPASAPDKVVKNFLAKDKMPEIVGANGKRTTITLQQLADIAGRRFSKTVPTDWNKLPGLVAYAGKQLHGLVHGGNIVVQLYKDGTSVGFCPSEDSFTDLLKNCTVIAQLVLVVASELQESNQPIVLSEQYSSAYHNFKDVFGID